MSDSAGPFSGPTVARPSAADRPVNNLSDNGFQTGAADAAGQAAASEATVIGVDQDQGSADSQAAAASGQVTQRAGIANAPGPEPR